MENHFSNPFDEVKEEIKLPERRSLRRENSSSNMEFEEDASNNSMEIAVVDSHPELNMVPMFCLTEQKIEGKEEDDFGLLLHGDLMRECNSHCCLHIDQFHDSFVDMFRR